MKKNTITLGVGAVLIVIFLLLLSTFQVRTTQVAVVSTFSKPSITYTNAGLYPKLPWPVQKVYYFDKRVQNYEDKFTEDITADGISLLTSVYIGWKITDPQAFFLKFENGSVAKAEEQLQSILRSSKSAVVGRHRSADFVSANSDGAKFEAIENEILTMIGNEVRTNGYGLDVSFLGIKRLGLPESVTQSVFDEMTKERNILISAAQHEGEAEAQKIRSDADRRANEVLAAARGQAVQIQGKGETEALQYLAVFQKNPELANVLFRLTALEESLKERSTLILDQQTPPFDLFKGLSVTNAATK